MKISIIIATFNSEKTLPLVLESIKKQTFPSDKIEVLLVDGGSVDRTFKIAKKFNCRVINNPRTEPVYGKYLAYLNAGGHLVMYLDHDEVLENKNSISLKVAAFEASKKIEAVIGSGYKSPQGYPFINDYINEFGDPFSFFIYGLSKNSEFFLKAMKNRYPIASENNFFSIFDLSKANGLPLIELVAGGSMFNIDYFKKEFPQTLKNFEMIPHFFYLLMSKKPYVAITQNDILIHYSADTLRKYFNKIRWRIKNNIYHSADMGISGFSGRDKFQPSFLRLKKYLFIPYACSIILPLIDSIKLAVSRKKLAYLFHLPLTVLTAGFIVYYFFLKMLGINPQLRSYDESKIVPAMQ